MDTDRGGSGPSESTRAPPRRAATDHNADLNHEVSARWWRSPKGDGAPGFVDGRSNVGHPPRAGHRPVGIELIHP